MLQNKKTLPLTLALLLSFGVSVETTYAFNNQDLATMPADNTTTKVATVAQNRSGSWFCFFLPIAFLVPLIGFLVNKGRSNETKSTKEVTIPDPEVLGAVVGGSLSLFDNGGTEMAAGTVLATDSRILAIADSHQEQSDLPEMPNPDPIIEGVTNKFGELTANLNTPKISHLNDAVKIVPNQAKYIATNINNPQVSHLDVVVEGVTNKSELTSKLNTPEMPNFGSTVEIIEEQAGRGKTFKMINYSLNHHTDSLQSTDFLDKITAKTGERTSEIK